MDRHLALFAQRRDGTVMMDHCRAVVEQTGLWPNDFPPPIVPPALMPVWDWYWELRRAAGTGRDGPEPLKFSEMLAWSRLKRKKLSQAELHWLTALDAAYLNNIRRTTARPKRATGKDFPVRSF